MNIGGYEERAMLALPMRLLYRVYSNDKRCVKRSLLTLLNEIFTIFLHFQVLFFVKE